VPRGDAVAALCASDPVLAGLIEAVGTLDEEARAAGRPTDPYGSLLRSIVGQQLSTLAARTIYGRVAALFDDRAPTPAEMLAADPDELRACGLSRPKIAYLRDLAEHVESGELAMDRLHELSDDEVIAQLTAVKGLGQWTADMFLIFHLDRPDVLPVGDLGIRRAAERAYGLPDLPDAKTLTGIAEPWRPNRSLASLYLWRSLDNTP